MIFHENRLLAIHMKYHTLFFRKFGKMLQNLPSAAVVIGSLRVNQLGLQCLLLKGKPTHITDKSEYRIQSY